MSTSGLFGSCTFNAYDVRIGGWLNKFVSKWINDFDCWRNNVFVAFIIFFWSVVSKFDWKFCWLNCLPFLISSSLSSSSAFLLNWTFMFPMLVWFVCWLVGWLVCLFVCLFIYYFVSSYWILVEAKIKMKFFSYLKYEGRVFVLNFFKLKTNHHQISNFIVQIKLIDWIANLIEIY